MPLAVASCQHTFFTTTSPSPKTSPRTTINMNRSFLGSIKDKFSRKNSTESNRSTITRIPSMANPKDSNPFAGSTAPTRRPGNSLLQLSDLLNQSN